MEIVWLSGVIVVISGVIFLIARLFETPHPKKKKLKRPRIRGSSLAIIDDGGAHTGVSHSYSDPGDVDCD